MSEDNQQPPNNWYTNNYNRINASAIDSGIYSKILHNFLELPRKLAREKVQGITILEVGANIGEHIPYVARKWQSYIATDIRSPQTFQIELIRNRGASFQVADVENLPFIDSQFDRVISTCLFHHLKNPEQGFREIRRVVKNQGSISILIPNDPGSAYRMLWKLTTLRNARKSGLGSFAKINHSKEHRNHYQGLMVLLNENFKNDKIKIIGLPFILRSYSLNVLTVVYITKIDS